MILIDKPYVSDFLIQTIVENGFSVLGTRVAKEMVVSESMNWKSEKEATEIIGKDPNCPVIANSENAIGWIGENLKSTRFPGQIQVFKNKIKFRELLQDAYPQLFFKKVEFHQLEKVDLAELKFPLIIKPAVGFFSIGVHQVSEANDWGPSVEKIKNELESLEKHYPVEVLDATDFILEEKIEGEEYAVDCYFDKDGAPVVLNILHHVFSSDTDVSDRVYSTSQEIFESRHVQVRDFLKIIGEKVGLRNFPAHVEIRIDRDGKLTPIEVNPLRFGGWCTTGDLSWYAFGFNSYEYFLKGKRPDWQKIFEKRAGKKYNVIVLDNNSGIEESEIDAFDYDLLLSDFEKPLSLRKVDFAQYSVFGFLFTASNAADDGELLDILHSDLRRYIKKSSEAQTRS